MEDHLGSVVEVRVEVVKSSSWGRGEREGDVQLDLLRASPMHPVLEQHKDTRE